MAGGTPVPIGCPGNRPSRSLLHRRRRHSARRQKFFLHYQALGWKINGRSPITDWRSFARKWIMNSAPLRHRPSQATPSRPPARGQRQEFRRALINRPAAHIACINPAPAPTARELPRNSEAMNTTNITMPSKQTLPFDFEWSLNFFEKRGNEQFGPKFKIYSEDREVIYRLLVYFLRHEGEATRLGLELNKGIFTNGPGRLRQNTAHNPHAPRPPTRHDLCSQTPP